MRVLEFTFFTTFLMPPKKKVCRKRGKGFLDFFKKIGNRDTWTDIGKKFVEPAMNIKNAAEGAYNSLKHKETWQDAARDPVGTFKDKTLPWIKDNKVVSSLIKLAPSIPGVGTAAKVALGEAASKAGFGLYKKKGGGVCMRRKRR